MLDQTSWEAATHLANGWYASGKIGVAEQRATTLDEAVDVCLEDCEVRELSETTMRRRRPLLKKAFMDHDVGRACSGVAIFMPITTVSRFLDARDPVVHRHLVKVVVGC